MATKSPLFIVLFFALAFSGCSQNHPAQTVAGRAASPLDNISDAPAPGDTAALAVATFASGCFWCSEEVFEQLKGVEKVISGYTGGRLANPSYEQVSTGTTGHAEAIRIWYNPEVLTFAELLEVFFASHDPTTLNRQGADRGTHYRSAIFYNSEEEKNMAQAFIERLNKSGEFSGPIVTQLEPLSNFYEAEPYHQDYFKLYPNDPYMRAVSRPKVDKVRKQFKDKLK